MYQKIMSCDMDLSDPGNRNICGHFCDDLN